MREKKARPGDVELLKDESANAGDRSSAMLCLMVDGRYDLEPTIVGLLSHSSRFLRNEALAQLIHVWRREEHIPLALKLLSEARDRESRSSAAWALAAFVGKPRQYDVDPELRRTIVHALGEQLRNEPELLNGRSIYEGLLDIAGDGGAKKAEIPELVLDLEAQEPYDLSFDIDWRWLEERLPELNRGEPLPLPKYAKPGDLELIKDSALDARRAALVRLAKDADPEVEPVVRGLLDDPEEALRERALRSLVERWRCEDLVPKLIQRSAEASDPDVRSDAVRALATFVGHSGDSMPERVLNRKILSALGQRLRDETDPEARSFIYMNLLELAGDEDGSKFAEVPDMDAIRSDAEIDWVWLKEQLPELLPDA
ncbi:MAG: HEAT repeat domain-containing protein [Myxococcota bacterium]